jgi:hypothetical protein
MKERSKKGIRAARKAPKPVIVVNLPIPNTPRTLWPNWRRMTARVRLGGSPVQRIQQILGTGVADGESA